jgi:hypothetical protein
VVRHLLFRFFREQGFAGIRELIRANLDALRNDAYHRAAVCTMDGQTVGIVTVTTMLHVEWGRSGEIGDLYVADEEDCSASGRGCDPLVPFTRLLPRHPDDHTRG